MNRRSWFNKREVKKVQKLRREFSFLTDMMSSNYIQLLEEMQRNENEINIGLSELKEEIERISITEQQNQEKFEESLNKLGDAACYMEKNLKKMSSKISELRNSVSTIQDGIDSNNTVLENKAKEIMQSTEEVKSLMKIVAVNNLLDEM